MTPTTFIPHISTQPKRYLLVLSNIVIDRLGGFPFRYEERRTRNNASRTSWAYLRLLEVTSTVPHHTYMNGWEFCYTIVGARELALACLLLASCGFTRVVTGRARGRSDQHILAKTCGTILFREKPLVSLTWEKGRGSVYHCP